MTSGINEKLLSDIVYKQSKNGDFKKYRLVILDKGLYHYHQSDLKRSHKLYDIVNIQLNMAQATIDSMPYDSFTIQFQNEIITYYCKLGSSETWVKKILQAKGTNGIENYELLESKGKGGSGEVYRGIHKKTKKEFAIKIMNKSAMSSINLLQTRREIEILKNCFHPNVIRFVESFEDSTCIYIIMEYCNGCELLEYVYKKGYLTDTRAQNLIRQIISGVKYLHLIGIIHRDLKPDNIMVIEKNPNEVVVKIIDFSLSMIMSQTEMVNEGVGTIYYASPEVLVREPYNFKVDIWSIGIIMYYLLSSELPFDHDGNNDDKIADLIISNPVQFSQEIWTKRSPKYFMIINACLEKNQNERTNIDQILKAL